MAARKGPRKLHRYSAEIKLKAVKRPLIDGPRVQDVEAAWLEEVRPEFHPAAQAASISGDARPTLLTVEFAGVFYAARFSERRHGVYIR